MEARDKYIGLEDACEAVGLSKEDCEPRVVSGSCLSSYIRTGDGLWHPEKYATAHPLLGVAAWWDAPRPCGKNRHIRSTRPPLRLLAGMHQDPSGRHAILFPTN